MKVKDIEIRLEELDRMESQILFSVSILSADDHVRLARIKEERAELKAKLEKMNEKKELSMSGCILTHEQEEFINDGRPRDNALKIFRAKAYGNGGNKDGKNVKRGTGKT